MSAAPSPLSIHITETCRIAIDDWHLSHNVTPTLLLVSGMKIDRLSSLSGEWHKINFRLFPCSSLKNMSFSTMDIFVAIRSPMESFQDYQARLFKRMCSMRHALCVQFTPCHNDLERHIDQHKGGFLSFNETSVVKMWDDIENAWNHIQHKNTQASV